jgi:hypothetical protein
VSYLAKIAKTDKLLTCFALFTGEQIFRGEKDLTIGKTILAKPYRR